MLLAPPVATALLNGLQALWVGGAARRSVRELIDTRERLGSPLWHLVDDGRLAGGALAAPVDGEGMPTREVTLVAEGRLRQPLVSWLEARPPDRVSSGCRRRPSWRELPRTAPTHLYQRPDPRVRVSDLLAELERGYYLVEPAGGIEVDLGANTFLLPVDGFAIQRGRATEPVAGALLRGRISGFLRGLRGVARDLTFFPFSGMVGSPSLLVSGVELVGPS